MGWYLGNLFIIILNFSFLFCWSNNIFIFVFGLIFFKVFIICEVEIVLILLIFKMILFIWMLVFLVGLFGFMFVIKMFFFIFICWVLKKILFCMLK